MDAKKNLWDGWRTVGVIGRGSFGTVYQIERRVGGGTEKAALKVVTVPHNKSDIDELLGEGYDGASITKRFESYLREIMREYGIMAEMKGCANIVYCDDVRYVQHDDDLGWDIFIKMELLTPLTRALPTVPDDRQVAKLAWDICGALAFCEKRNILHRDIKPQNILMAPDGTYKLGDFGIAKTAEKTERGTKTGTFNYMAPEVFNNRPYGLRADIYSFGLVLYWLLNERRGPFLPLPPEVPTGSAEAAARQRRFAGEPLPPPAHGCAELRRIALKACAYDPEQRYRDANEMLADLRMLRVSLVKADIPEDSADPWDTGFTAPGDDDLDGPRASGAVKAAVTESSADTGSAGFTAPGDDDLDGPPADESENGDEEIKTGGEPGDEKSSAEASAAETETVSAVGGLFSLEEAAAAEEGPGERGAVRSVVTDAAEESSGAEKAGFGTFGILAGSRLYRPGDAPAAETGEKPGEIKPREGSRLYRPGDAPAAPAEGKQGEIKPREGSRLYRPGVSPVAPAGGKQGGIKPREGSRLYHPGSSCDEDMTVSAALRAQGAAPAGQRPEPYPAAQRPAPAAPSPRSYGSFEASREPERVSAPACAPAYAAPATGGENRPGRRGGGNFPWGIVAAIAVMLVLSVILIVIMTKDNSDDKDDGENPPPTEQAQVMPAPDTQTQPAPAPAQTAAPAPTPVPTPAPTPAPYLPYGATTGSTVSDKGYSLEYPTASEYYSSPTVASVKSTAGSGIYIMPMPESGHGNLGTVLEGARVELIGRRGAFYFFRTADGRMGWNGESFFVIDSIPSRPDAPKTDASYSTVSDTGYALEQPESGDWLSVPFYAKVKSSGGKGIYIMPMPEKGHGHLGTVREGETVTIYAYRNGFYYFVTKEGHQGWNGEGFFVTG